MEQVRQQDFPAHDRAASSCVSGERHDIESVNVGLFDDHGRLVASSASVATWPTSFASSRTAPSSPRSTRRSSGRDRGCARARRGRRLSVVAEQAGRLVAADGYTLVRVEPGDHVRILSNSSRSPRPGCGRGARADRLSAAMTAALRPPARAVPARPPTARPAHPGRQRHRSGQVGGRRPVARDRETWRALVASRREPQPLSPVPSTDSGRSHRSRRHGDHERRHTHGAGTRESASSRLRPGAAATRANLHDGAQQRFVSLSLALRLTMSPSRAIRPGRPSIFREPGAELTSAGCAADHGPPAVAHRRVPPRARRQPACASQVPVDMTRRRAGARPEVEAAASLQVTRIDRRRTHYAEAGRARGGGDPRRRRRSR